MADGSEPIAEDELLYRRIPASTGWYSPDTELKPEAFAPHKTEDTSGLSIARAKYKSAEEAARGRPGKSYYVAVFRASELQAKGIVIEPRPLDNDPGHAELPDLNSNNRKEDLTLERERILVELTLRVEGPFTSIEQPPG